MKLVNWGRLLTAMVTPFRSDLQINYEAAAALAKMLVENGTDALVVGGTTGESPVLSHEEKIRLLETVVSAVGGRVPVIAGTGTNSTVDSLRLTHDSEMAGADGVMLVTPYYNKPPQAGLVEHFTAVAKATRLPVMLYNVPGRTSVNMMPDTVKRLSGVENIVAVKDASGSLDQVSELVRGVPDGFLVYSGDDSLTLPMLAVGGYGVVSVASHIVGPAIKSMIEAYVSGQNGDAALIHARLFPLYKALFMTTSPIPVKAALGLLGFHAGEPRMPLIPLSPDETAVLRRVMAELGLDMRAS